MGFHKERRIERILLYCACRAEKTRTYRKIPLQKWIPLAKNRKQEWWPLAQYLIAGISSDDADAADFSQEKVQATVVKLYEQTPTGVELHDTSA